MDLLYPEKTFLQNNFVKHMDVKKTGLYCNKLFACVQDKVVCGVPYEMMKLEGLGRNLSWHELEDVQDVKHRYIASQRRMLRGAFRPSQQVEIWPAHEASKSSYFPDARKNSCRP